MNRRTFIARATALLAVGGSVQAAYDELPKERAKFDIVEYELKRNKGEYTIITRDLNAAPTHKFTHTESGWRVEDDDGIVFKPDI